MPAHFINMEQETPRVLPALRWVPFRIYSSSAAFFTHSKLDKSQATDLLAPILIIDDIAALLSCDLRRMLHDGVLPEAGHLLPTFSRNPAGSTF
jgi:hypothetical protein